MPIRDLTQEQSFVMTTVGQCLTAGLSPVGLALTYTDAEGNTVTMLSGADALTLLARYADRRYMCLDLPHVSEDDIFAAGEFFDEYQKMWARRKDQLGWLDQMLKRTDYDPLENYDRKEDGGWKDTTDLGARSRTQNLTDSFATYTDTDTETPTVKTKTTETPTVKTRETVTPTVKTKETVTPTLKTKETVTPTVKTKETETPGVTETTTETPRAARTTTESRGISETVAESFYGDNSSTMVPSKNVVTTPGNGQNVTTIAGTNGTDTTEVSRTGNNTKTTEVLSGDTQTVNEVVSGDTQTINEIVSGNTETVNEVVSGNTETTNEVVSGNIQTTHLKGAHIDTHNTTFGEQAAQDVLTRLFQNYRVHGNIGVQAVSDMLLKEYNLRSRLDLPMLFIKDFLDSVTFYAE